jgi:hypothetical protein
VADYTPAHLRIGGEITDPQYQAIQRLTSDAAEVVAGEFCEIWDHQARGGAFPELEAYLIEESIAFDRFSEPALGYDGRLAQFRPGMAEPAEFTASADDHERLVAVREIEAILSSHLRQGGSRDSLVARLRVLCGPAVAPLPRFSTRPR